VALVTTPVIPFALVKVKLVTVPAPPTISTNRAWVMGFAHISIGVTPSACDVPNSAGTLF
jgi:hypothetical protein